MPQANTGRAQASVDEGLFAPAPRYLTHHTKEVCVARANGMRGDEDVNEKTDRVGDSGESTSSSAPSRRSIAFGIERIGLIPLQWPLVATFLLIVLSIGAAFGVSRIQVDDSLSQLFRSDTPEFRQYEEVSRRFPSSEFDVLVVIEGKTLLARESIEKLRDLITDLQLIDGTRGIISIFSARQPPDGGIPAPLFPDQM